MNEEQIQNLQPGVAIAPAGILQAPENPKLSKWYRWRHDGKSLLSYLLESEVHTFGFSVAANAILSFVPFVVLLYMLAQSVFHSHGMKVTIDHMVQYFFPADQVFVAKNLSGVAAGQGKIQLMSLVMILLACTGIFLPLEVALNQAWGVVKSRNYFMNQIVAFGLAILMVILGIAAIMVTTIFSAMFGDILLNHSGTFGDICTWLFNQLQHIVLAISTGIASILFFFCIYWLLPNRKVPWRPVLKTSIYTGLIWLLSKYLFVEFLLPHLDLESMYGRFSVSVGLIFWAYTTGLILFAGAQFSVARLGIKKEK